MPPSAETPRRRPERDRIDLAFAFSDHTVPPTHDGHSTSTPTLTPLTTNLPPGRSSRRRGRRSRPAPLRRPADYHPRQPMNNDAHPMPRATPPSTSTGASARRSPAPGVTLIEALVALSILAILAAIAAPSFNGLINRMRIDRAVSEITSALAFARMEAIRQNRQIIACIPNGTSTIIVAPRVTPTQPQKVMTWSTKVSVASTGLESINPHTGCIRLDPSGLSPWPPGTTQRHWRLTIASESACIYPQPGGMARVTRGAASC